MNRTPRVTKDGSSEGHDLRMRAVAIVLGMMLPAVSCGEDPVSFVADVAPILQNHCVPCHGVRRAEGGYRVDTFASLRTAGESGEQPIAKPEESELLRRLTTDDESERMPLDAHPLTEKQVGTIRQWLAEGSPFDGDSDSVRLYRLLPPPKYPPPPDSYASPVPVSALTFSPDGTRLLASGYHEILVWEVSTGKLVQRIGNLPQRISSLEFLPDGNTLAAAGGQPGRIGELRLVELKTGRIVSVVGRTNDMVLDAAVRPGSTQIAVSAADSIIRIYDGSTGKLVRSVTSHADWVSDIAWTPDGKRLVSASRDGSARVFDAESGKLIANYGGHSAPVRGVATAADGKDIVSVDAGGKLHRWTIAGTKRTAALTTAGESFKLARRENLVLVPGSDGQLRAVDLATNKVLRTFCGHTDWVLSAAFSRDGKIIAAGGFDGQVRIWNTADGTLKRTWVSKP